MALTVLCAAAFTAAAGWAQTKSGGGFDSRRAYSYLVKQVSFGPRVPGMKAHSMAREWIYARLRETTPNVMLQAFTGTVGGKEVMMHNILASFRPELADRILLCAHWDSRGHADKDPDPKKRTLPVPGANDGASGVAVLLEAARIIGEKNLQKGVDIVFFDGEDGGDYGRDETWLLGSRHFARAMTPSYRPRFAVLLDMIGDRDLSLTRDAISMKYAPELWDHIRKECARLGIPFTPGETGVLDDHVPLIERGIPAVDLIDFEYPPWHTVSDTPDKCSPESLGKIGALVLSLVDGE